MPSLEKSVLITGCSAGGIGAGLAEAFQTHGYHVFATVRNPAKAPPNLSREPHITILILDVLSAESIAAAVASITKETGGRLDVLVNNSGQNLVMPALDQNIDDGRKLFDLNFFAPLAVLQAFAPLLVEAKGCVVNQSSAAAYLPMPFLSQYYISPQLLSPIWCCRLMLLLLQNRHVQRLEICSYHGKRHLATRARASRSSYHYPCYH